MSKSVANPPIYNWDHVHRAAQGVSQSSRERVSFPRKTDAASEASVKRQPLSEEALDAGAACTAGRNRPRR